MVIVIAFFPDDSLEGSSTFLDTKPVIVYYIETYAVLVTVHCFVFIAIFSPILETIISLLCLLRNFLPVAEQLVASSSYDTARDVTDSL
jgi:hypothetical protein